MTKRSILTYLRHLRFGALPASVGPSRFGFPNLLKRLQVPDILDALALASSDVVLDFGCGTGYVTFELAKRAKLAVGIDVDPFVTSIPIPLSLTQKLRFEARPLPHEGLPDAYFDVVLASEVLPMIADPAVMVRALRRTLKSGGRLIVVNGVGHPAIESAYSCGSARLEALRRAYPDRFWPSYSAYAADLQASFATARRDFLSATDIRALLDENGFDVVAARFSPARSAGSELSWRQFESFLSGGRSVSTEGFLAGYLKLAWRSAWDPEDHQGGAIVIARAR
jgi:SAM-dependent methyltransferase